MSKWQPIEGAPKDGTRVLISDGKYFTAAKWWFYEAPSLHSYGYGPNSNGWPTYEQQKWSIEQVPNPKAGQRSYRWYQDNPVSFSEDEYCPPDYDGNFDNLEPTHWMPLPDPPPLQVSYGAVVS